MTKTEAILKRIGGLGVKSDDVPSMFTRNGSGRLRGIASFGDGSSSVLLEVADTPVSRMRGMMGRTDCPECCGMLFTGLDGGSFWMKGCRIPLDIVFVKDGVVTLTYSMEADGGRARYPYGDETEAIELPFGYCERHGITRGTECSWRTW